MEKTMKNVDKQVLNLDEMGLPTHATPAGAPAESPKRRRKAAAADDAAPVRKRSPKKITVDDAAVAEPEYPELINLKIARVFQNLTMVTDENGDAVVDEETGEVLYDRKCTLVATTDFDGIVVKDDNYVVGKTRNLYLPEWYLIYIAKLSNKRLRIYLDKKKDLDNIKWFTKYELQALLEDIEIVVNRKFHKAGDIYIAKDGTAKTFSRDTFDRDILEMNIPAENIDLFKEELEERIREKRKA